MCSVSKFISYLRKRRQNVSTGNPAESDVGHVEVLHDRLPEGDGLHLMERKRVALLVDVSLHSFSRHGGARCSPQDALLGLVGHAGELR